jgi:hypothetical protein
VAQTWDRMTHTSMVLPEMPVEAPDPAGYLYSATKGNPISQDTLQMSWNNAPKIVRMKGGISKGYQYHWRTYEFQKTEKTMTFDINASKKQPIKNICFKIANWTKNASANLSINGITQEQGPNFRQGIVLDTSGKYAMLIWIELTATSKSRNVNGCLQMF